MNKKTVLKGIKSDVPELEPLKTLPASLGAGIVKPLPAPGAAPVPFRPPGSMAVGPAPANPFDPKAKKAPK